MSEFNFFSQSFSCQTQRLFPPDVGAVSANTSLSSPGAENASREISVDWDRCVRTGN